jgi:N-acetylglucosaminyldiphosphoundecaprenol N-acetyl-beta-D-mannosaminyltransferase
MQVLHPSGSTLRAEDIMSPRCQTHLLEPFGVEVAALPFAEAVARVIGWAEAPTRGRFVCLANVHMVVEATRHRCLSAALRAADLVLADGMPLVWMMSGRRKRRDRIAGMDLLPALCGAAEAANIPVYFWGSTASTLQAVYDRLQRERPRFQLAGMSAAGLGRIRHAESRQVLDRIRETGARLVFVALGCPKQELWMRRHHGGARAVFVGVGGALDVYAGLRPRAPRAMQRLGLEWAYRLAQEPSRLWRRYFLTNTAFLWRLLQAQYPTHGRK